MKSFANGSVAANASQRHECLEPRLWKSERYQAVMRQAQRFARTPGTILLEGESGTGKTRLARHLHALSNRSARPFHELSLAAVEDSLASSELFGHTVGAFTDAKRARSGAFVTANTGTLFLDEIGKASTTVQRKLLVAIESQVITPVGSDAPVRTDVRLILASNIPLRTLAETNVLLPDLVPRLGAFTIRLPALRERREDIPLLATAMVARHSVAMQLSEPPEIDGSLMRALQRAEWPNNLRELDATLQRIVVDAEGASRITLDHCIDDLLYLRALATSARTVSPQHAAKLADTQKSRALAAKQLGISPATLYRRLRAEKLETTTHDRVISHESRNGDRPTLNGMSAIECSPSKSLVHNDLAQ